VLKRLGRGFGFTWYAVTVLVPWRLSPFLTPFQGAFTNVPGFIEGELKAQDIITRWRSIRSTRRIARGISRDRLRRGTWADLEDW
jgi:hypothetical protein